MGKRLTSQSLSISPSQGNKGAIVHGTLQAGASVSLPSQPAVPPLLGQARSQRDLCQAQLPLRPQDQSLNRLKGYPIRCPTSFSPSFPPYQSHPRSPVTDW
ncbi:hypothetical protein FS842_006367 [Serendipita sp. 407]|nr:hypothetical protein FS842_006367 [Serendipita sp. 407]